MASSSTRPAVSTAINTFPSARIVSIILAKKLAYIISSNVEIYEVFFPTQDEWMDMNLNLN